MTLVKDLMTPNPTTIQASGSLQEAAALMRDGDFGLLPVLEGNSLVGVVTDRDLVLRGLAADRVTTVGEICTRAVKTIPPNASDGAARAAMEEAGVRRLPVQDAGKVVGMVSVGDLAVRADPRLAGSVMEKTGPDAHPNGDQAAPVLLT